MNKKLIYIGLDVDDTQYHGAGRPAPAFDKETGEIVSFNCRPTLKGLVSQLEKTQKYFEAGSLKLCYEASYIGHCLQRDLMQAGYYCDVISPGSIPRKGSKSIKTDRIDALDLAQFYANDLLTVVQIPDAETEQDRDLLRSRQQLIKQQSDLRRHLQSLLRRNGRHYKAETQYKTHWTKHHYCWLERTAEGCSGSLGVNLRLLLRLLLRQLKSINEIIVAYSEEIESMAKKPNYQQAVSALTCYKGIKNLFALTMITEIGDVKRFAHPRQLGDCVGMDIREYSSGGKQHRFGITKQGNRYLRTAFIEANQRAYRTTKLSREIKAWRANANPEYIAIADRCLRRLSKKGNRLLEAGKHPNKVKVACAREMIGFVWESLSKVAA